MFFLKSFYLIESDYNLIISYKFNKSYGTIIEDLDIDGYGLYYYPIYLFVRLIYPITIIFLYEYPRLQLVLVIFFILLPVRCSPLVDDPLLHRHPALHQTVPQCHQSRQ